MKTWDEFIARQVEATLKQQQISSEAIRHETHWLLQGTTWVYVFGAWADRDAEYWYVNPTERKVIYVFKTT